MKIKTYFLTVCALVMISCGGVYYFDLYIQPLQTDQTDTINKVLRIDDIESSEAYWRQSIVYRKSPYEVQYMSFWQWSKRPEELIKDTIVQYYRNSSLFEKVVDNHSSIEPDMVMKVNIDFMEMFYEESQWYARLSLDIELVDFKTEKSILTHYFDRKMALESKRVIHVPGKISLILQEELMKLVDKLKKYHVENQ